MTAADAGTADMTADVVFVLFIGAEVFDAAKGDSSVERTSGRSVCGDTVIELSGWLLAGGSVVLALCSVATLRSPPKTPPKTGMVMLVLPLPRLKLGAPGGAGTLLLPLPFGVSTALVTLPLPTNCVCALRDAVVAPVGFIMIAVAAMSPEPEPELAPGGPTATARPPREDCIAPFVCALSKPDVPGDAVAAESGDIKLTSLWFAVLPRLTLLSPLVLLLFG